MTAPVQNQNYQIFPQFTGVDDGCTDAVYLLPPQFQYGHVIPITVPWLYIGSGSTLPSGTSNDDFTIAFSQNGGGTPTQANVDVNVTLAANNIWNCAPSARSELMENFVSLLEWIETNLELPATLPPVLIPGATMRIASAIADNIPAPLVETLFYRYGFSPGLAPGTLPYVDICPGMRLRIETSVSQFISSGSPLNGYIATGRFEYDVASTPPPTGSGLRLVTFDPFLGSTAMPNISSEASPATAGGIIDLQVGGAQAYWRLIYPGTMTPPDQAGDVAIGDNVALFGTPTYSALQTATTGYPSTPTSPATAAVFLGRSIAVPEIPIWIALRGQSNVEYVPVGTTIANVLEHYTTAPLNPSQSVISMSRVSSAATSGNSAVVQLSNFNIPVIDPRIYDLPLIGGDNLTLNF